MKKIGDKYYATQNKFLINKFITYWACPNCVVNLRINYQGFEFENLEFKKKRKQKKKKGKEAHLGHRPTIRPKPSATRAAQPSHPARTHSVSVTAWRTPLVIRTTGSARRLSLRHRPHASVVTVSRCPDAVWSRAVNTLPQQPRR
jgi:hypothetical protein